jgi:hypothetical protein
LTEWQVSSGTCLNWFRWFEDRGVPAAIIQDGAKFAVFRKGVIQRKTGCDLNYKYRRLPSRFTNDPRIVISCNGYANP